MRTISVILIYAGPFLNFVGLDGRIDKTDAKFVDIIHTDSTLFGTTESLGHVDFFVNGGNGVNQEPNCLIFAIAGLGCKYSFSIVKCCNLVILINNSF